ncbi:unnamed protein product [Acanthoscelides obtectus]|uniref:DNA methyltransferase 2 n=1 Tax=Acanthoscelides obtectus TaxID=200917 RepID=A0A9P0M7S1_ACAOB|nr:unnamed protein product [Acanthoscelides obtectus]CAK1689225.1 tRNA (cytosine-5-)-methyltransferase [Acanthoscelides obtectus]
MNVLELYSGIGGMQLALKESGVDGRIIAALEINTIAIEIYKHNFPEANLLNANIEGLTAEFVNKLNVNTILMSPPCQPFTRNGLQNDVNDKRTASFLHVLSLLKDLDIRNILIENVKGFETSTMRNILVDTLNENGYTFQEFLLTPQQFGIPNSRLRYYCLAKKLPEQFSFKITDMKHSLPVEIEAADCFPISTILDDDVNETFYLSDSILQKYCNIIDICYKHSKRSCCFTKAYGRFIEGTGSIFTDKTEEEVEKVYLQANQLTDTAVKGQLLKNLGLRFFTPKEVCRLMSFPDTYSFPTSVSDKKKYMVLGNSINVKVVSELIKLLYS